MDNSKVGSTTFGFWLLPPSVRTEKSVMGNPVELAKAQAAKTLRI